MPTRHGGSLAKNANTSLRLSLRATTTLPSASTPWTWNTFFARSSPMLVIVVMDGSSLVIRHQRSLYGTSMPSEAPSTSSRTVLAAASDECQLTSRFLTNPCTAQAGRSGPRKHFNLDLDFRNAHRDFPLLI